MAAAMRQPPADDWQDQNAPMVSNSLDHQRHPGNRRRENAPPQTGGAGRMGRAGATGHRGRRCAAAVPASQEAQAAQAQPQRSRVGSPPAAAGLRVAPERPGLGAAAGAIHRQAAEAAANRAQPADAHHRDGRAGGRLGDLAGRRGEADAADRRFLQIGRARSESARARDQGRQDRQRDRGRQIGAGDRRLDCR